MAICNLWDETIECLEHHNLTWNDVQYVAGQSFQITKENFEEVARNTNYDAGYGTAEVARDLVLVGSNWWLVRAEYDGSECWRFLKQPDVLGLQVIPITSLAKPYGGTLNDINEPINLSFQYFLKW